MSFPRRREGACQRAQRPVWCAASIHPTRQLTPFKLGQGLGTSWHSTLLLHRGSHLGLMQFRATHTDPRQCRYVRPPFLRRSIRMPSVPAVKTGWGRCAHALLRHRMELGGICPAGHRRMCEDDVATSDKGSKIGAHTRSPVPKCRGTGRGTPGLAAMCPLTLTLLVWFVPRLLQVSVLSSGKWGWIIPPPLQSCLPNRESPSCPGERACTRVCAHTHTHTPAEPAAHLPTPGS